MTATARGPPMLPPISPMTVDGQVHPAGKTGWGVGRLPHSVCVETVYDRGASRVDSTHVAREAW